MRRAILILALSVALLASAAADEIAFNGGSSSIVLREGRENVILSDGASVTVGSMEITADTITLSGEGWTRVECSGHAKIVDDERGISIETEGIYYDREEERILISSWYEIEDTVNVVSATGASLEYRLNEERLQLDKNVMLLKDTDSGIIDVSDSDLHEATIIQYN